MSTQRRSSSAPAVVEKSLTDLLSTNPGKLCCGHCFLNLIPFKTSSKENAKIITEEVNLYKPKCCVCSSFYHVHCCDVKDDEIFRRLGNLKPFWKCYKCFPVPPSEVDQRVQDRIQFLQSSRLYEIKLYNRRYFNVHGVMYV